MQQVWAAEFGDDSLEQEEDLGKVAMILDDALARYPTDREPEDLEAFRRWSANMGVRPEIGDSLRVILGFYGDPAFSPGMHIDEVMRLAAQGPTEFEYDGTPITLPRTGDCSGTAAHYREAASWIQVLERAARKRYGANEMSERYLRWLVNAARQMAQTFVACNRPASIGRVYPFVQSTIFATWVARLQRGVYDTAYEAQGGAPSYGAGADFREYVLDERELP